MAATQAVSFEQQLVAHRDHRLTFARLQLSNNGWAKDAVCAAMLAALNKPMHSPPDPSFKSWLASSLKHKLIDEFPGPCMHGVARPAKSHAGVMKLRRQ